MSVAHSGSTPADEPTKESGDKKTKNGEKAKKEDDEMGLAKPPPPPKKLTKGEELDKKIEEAEKEEEEEEKKEHKPEGINPHKSDEDEVPYDPKFDFSSSEKVKLESPLFFEARNDNTDIVEHWPINPYPFVLA